MMVSEDKAEDSHIDEAVTYKTSEDSSVGTQSPAELLSNDVMNAISVSAVSVQKTKDINSIRLVYPEFFPIETRLEQRTLAELKVIANSCQKNARFESTRETHDGNVQNWLDFF